MRPLPRVHALTDGRVLCLPDLGVRAAAIAAGGPAVALHARVADGRGEELFILATRFAALAAPPEAAMFVNGRCDIALATRASGVQLGQRHVPVADAKALCPGVLVGCSVHTPSEVDAAVGEGADFLLAGSIYDTPSHEGRAGTGVEFVSRAASTGVPVIAVGGLTSARAREVRDAGAWGVAAIRALWDAADPAQATLDLMAPWREM